MDAWLKEFYELFMYFFGRATPPETYMVVLLCVLFGALALSRVSTGLGALGAFYITGVLLTSAGLAVIVAALAVLPFLDFYAWWMVLAVPCTGVLLVVLPLTMRFQKCRYVTALIAWTVTLLVIAAVLNLEPMAMRTVKKNFEKAKNNALRLEQHRLETMEQLK
jgi:hypothetical protein